MPINKIIVLKIIVGFVSLAHIQTGVGGDFTIDQYLGVWYDVAIISPYDIPSYVSPILCQWSNVTKWNDDDKSFNEVFTFIFHWRPIISQGNGTIINSELRIVYATGEGGTCKYDVRSYNDGKELILYEKNGGMYSALISRNTTASAKVMADFESIAMNHGGHVHYLNNSDCPEIN